jgi:hypothetical protein
VALPQFSLEHGDAGVSVDQFLADRQRLAVGGQRPGGVARLGQHQAGVVVTVCEYLLELSDAGVSVDQFLLDRQRLAVGGQRPGHVARPE